jgi:hypothetical protein
VDIQPLEQGNLSARAYVALREGLIAGRFRPGQRLIMQELAELLGQFLHDEPLARPRHELNGAAPHQRSCADGPRRIERGHPAT